MRKSVFTYQFAVTTYPVRTLVARACRVIVRIRKIKLIFVFGMSRSGTTFLATALTLDERNTYVHEPVKKLMSMRFRAKDKDADPFAFWNYVFSEDLKPVKLHFLVCTVLRYLLSRKLRNGSTMCIKPISMRDSIEEVYKALGGSILFISRHPCGRTESIIRQGQHDHGLDVRNVEKLVRLGERWGKVHCMVRRQFGRHDDWLWVFFERLCRDPEGEMRLLYQRLGLQWHDGIRDKLRRMTMTESNKFYGIERNSRAQIDKWRTALTEEEVNAIRAGCAPQKTDLYQGF